jgi:hypothetical protein
MMCEKYALSLHLGKDTHAAGFWKQSNQRHADITALISRRCRAAPIIIAPTKFMSRFWSRNSAATEW